MSEIEVIPTFIGVWGFGLFFVGMIGINDSSVLEEDRERYYTITYVGIGLLVFSLLFYVLYKIYKMYYFY